MQQSEQMSGDSKEVLSEAVNETLGNPEEVSTGANEVFESDESPSAYKKKLGMQEKRHKKELRNMQSQLDEIRSYLGSNRQQEQPETQTLMGNSSDLNQQIYAAVAKALQVKDEQERKQRENENLQHVYRKQQDLSDYLDKSSEKYEDFDDVVKAHDAPFTESMRGMAMILHDIPGLDVSETLYRIGKDKGKLKELSKLHPIDQAKEVVRIAMSLMNNGKEKPNSSSNVRALGQVKNNPVTSSYVNDKTSASDIRKLMKNGGKNWAR